MTSQLKKNKNVRHATKPSISGSISQHRTKPSVRVYHHNVHLSNFIVVILGRCEASWGEPERDMTISTRLSDSVFTEMHALENALKSEYE